mmetsp:Transcript_7281/g.23297  ORF Transcript_7281/g.23297 Transcript_7281/m.23297 type:complete len:440 (-) Transcript_7281:1833-3152(-)
MPTPSSKMSHMKIERLTMPQLLTHIIRLQRTCTSGDGASPFTLADDRQARRTRRACHAASTSSPPPSLVNVPCAPTSPFASSTLGAVLAGPLGPSVASSTCRTGRPSLSTVSPSTSTRSPVATRSTRPPASATLLPCTRATFATWTLTMSLLTARTLLRLPATRRVALTSLLRSTACCAWVRPSARTSGCSPTPLTRTMRNTSASSSRFASATGCPTLSRSSRATQPLKRAALRLSDAPTWPSRRRRTPSPGTTNLCPLTSSTTFGPPPLATLPRRRCSTSWKRCAWSPRGRSRRSRCSRLAATPCASARPLASSPPCSFTLCARCEMSPSPRRSMPMTRPCARLPWPPRRSRRRAVPRRRRRREAAPAVARPPASKQKRAPAANQETPQRRPNAAHTWCTRSAALRRRGKRVQERGACLTARDTCDMDLERKRTSGWP